MSRQRTLRIELDEDAAAPVFGVKDGNLRAIEQATGATLSARGRTVQLEGTEDAVRAAGDILGQLAELVGDGVPLRSSEVEAAARLVAASPDLTLRRVMTQEAVAPSERRRLVARSPVQQAYITAMRSHEMVFGIGPAGTGKTYLAVGLALEALRQRTVRRIVLTRPAVEAGERLGFLPGDIEEKVNPYLRPLHDAIRDLADGEVARSLLERGDLEVAPLAFMRGRTLNDCFIILDEAQNTTHEQMKMFLTRMGPSSRMVVTGDVTQVDLPPGVVSGLAEAARILRGIPGIAIVRFSERDVVRHRLVREIVKAYERDGRQLPEAAGEDAPGGGRGAADGPPGGGEGPPA
jgi:phosphate starvation-inducible PhoH-like protein